MPSNGDVILKSPLFNDIDLQKNGRRRKRIEKQPDDCKRLNSDKITFLYMTDSFIDKNRCNGCGKDSCGYIIYFINANNFLISVIDFIIQTAL